MAARACEEATAQQIHVELAFDLERCAVVVCDRSRGIATREGKPPVDGVEVGDKVVEIGGVRLDRAEREAVFAAMKGRAREKKVVVVERVPRALTPSGSS